MKKMVLVLTSCVLLGLGLASCGTTRGTVAAQSAATGTAAPETEPNRK